MNNPALIRQMMENPMVQQMISNPEIMRQMMLSNPQMRELMEVGFWFLEISFRQMLPTCIQINSLCF